MIAAIVAIVKKYGRRLVKTSNVEQVVRDFIREETDGAIPETVQVKEEKLEERISEEYGEELIDGSYFLDGEYWTTSKEEFEQVASLELVENLPYRPDRFDCENFAFLFQTVTAFVFGVNTVGVVLDFEAGHAYNMIYTEDGTLRLYEPQDDKFVEVGDSLGEEEDSNYTLDDSVVIF